VYYYLKKGAAKEAFHLLNDKNIIEICKLNIYLEAENFI